jgi:hypothetical protein
MPFCKPPIFTLKNRVADLDPGSAFLEAGSGFRISIEGEIKEL